MRLPKAAELRKLAQITRTRELAAQAELERLSGERRDIEIRIAELREDVAAGDSVVAAAALARWQVWQEEEMNRLTSSLALATAEFVQASRCCGRAVAENSVADELVSLSTARRATEAERREIEERTLALTLNSPLHFLTDDVGDQDI